MIKHILLILVYIAVPFHAHAQLIQTSAKQAIVVDYETGTVLFEKNADQKMPTSSMSKVMTMYLIFDALKNGTIALDDTFLVSEEAWRKGGSKMFVEVDKKVKIEDLIRGVIVQSGNDATIVLAEGLSGSEDAFAGKMNEVAHNIGMSKSNFKNASGWPDPDHYSTAEDLATLAQALIQNFPDYYPYYSETEFTYNAIPQKNRNPLLYQNIGADGIKTGHTEAGGYGLIGAGIANDRRVVMVINGLESASARAQESKKLLQWGLNRFKNETLFKAGETVETAPVILGQKETVNLALKEDLKLTLPHNTDRDVKIKVSYNGPIQAPIQEGQELATLTITPPGLPETSLTLFAAENVPELGLFARVVTKAKLLVAGQ